MKRLLAVLSCMAICLSFAACGAKDDSSDEKSESKASVESSEVTESKDEASSADAAEGKTIQDFIDDNKETFDVLKDSLKRFRHGNGHYSSWQLSCLYIQILY